MSKKEIFIDEIENLLFEAHRNLSDDAMSYFEALKNVEEKAKPLFTENGKLVLEFMQQNKDLYNNLFKSKNIGEAIGISSRTVSGAMRKLVTDGYVEKMGENPVCYSLTDKGTSADTNAE